MPLSSEIPPNEVQARELASLGLKNYFSKKSVPSQI